MSILAPAIGDSIHLDIDVLLKCYQFALDSLSTHIYQYGKRGQHDLSKILQDISLGKMAEVAVWHWLNRTGHNPSYPDFAVLHGRSKSFDPDIEACGMRVHVKSMTGWRAEHFGRSFLFQKNDPLVRSPSYMDRIIPCIVENDTVDIIGIFDPATIRWQEPELEKLRHSKVCFWC